MSSRLYESWIHTYTGINSRLYKAWIDAYKKREFTLIQSVKSRIYEPWIHAYTIKREFTLIY